MHIYEHTKYFTCINQSGRSKQRWRQQIHRQPSSWRRCCHPLRSRGSSRTEATSRAEILAKTVSPIAGSQRMRLRRAALPYGRAWPKRTHNIGLNSARLIYETWRARTRRPVEEERVYHSSSQALMGCAREFIICWSQRSSTPGVGLNFPPCHETIYGPRFFRNYVIHVPKAHQEYNRP